MAAHATELVMPRGEHQAVAFPQEKLGIHVSSNQPPRLSRASVRVGNRQLQLMDADAEGFSVLIPPDSPLPAPGEAVDWVVCIDGREVLAGRATVGAGSRRRSGTSLRLAIASGRMNPALIEAHQVLADLPERVGEAQSVVSDEYKVVCADIVARLRKYRRLAEKFDEAAASNSEAGKGALQIAAARMASDWKALAGQAARLVLPNLADAESVAALRAYTQQLVTPELTPGAIWRRAFEKPRGYPGDYGVMNYCYTPQEIGDSSYARLCHGLGLDFVQCVRTRKDAVREVLRERIGRQPAVSAMSIACGSAHEIFDLASAGGIARPLHATLVDQDAEALDFAHSRLLPYLGAEGRGLTTSCVQAQFGDYSDPNGTALPAGQDLIYCFGMFDYLPNDLVAGIVPVLFSKLKPGGTLVVGNLRPAPEMIWPLCFVLGYDMWFRTAREMLALAEPLAGCRPELRLESTGYNYLLFLHRQ